MKRNTFSVLFFIKKNEVKRNGLVTIMVRITINGQQAQFSSRLEIEPSLWNQKKQLVIITGETKQIDPSFVEQINNKLFYLRADIQRHYINLTRDREFVSVHRLKQAVLSTGDEYLLSYQFREQVKIYRSKSGRNICKATIDMYKLTWKRLVEFMEKRYKVSDININHIDLWFLEKFFQYIRREYKCSNNTTVKYMKRFASILNFAERIGLVQLNPFKEFRFYIEEKLPVYLTQEEIIQVYNKEFLTERLALVRDAFVFSCYTGLSYVDIQQLRLSDIVFRKEQYWLCIQRKKTGHFSNIPLLDIPLKIMEKYKRKLENENGLLFPIKSNQKTNEYLKEIGEVCNIRKTLSYRVSRHSFAVMVLENGVSIESLSKMLGHKSMRTTQVYAIITNRKVKREMKGLRKM